MENFNMISFVKSLTNFRINIIGKTGSGKTVFARDLISKIQAYKKQKIMVVDVKKEFRDIKRFKTLHLNLNTFIRKMVGLDISGKKISNPSIIAEYAAAIIWAFAPATLYIEEIEAFVDVNAHLTISHQLLYKINQQGRERKANLITVNQQIGKLHKAFPNQASDIFLFAINQRELRDVEKILKLPPKTFNFDLPTKQEIEKKELKDLYRFYHIENLQKPVFYERMTFKKRGRPSTKKE